MVYQFDQPMIGEKLFSQFFYVSTLVGAPFQYYLLANVSNEGGLDSKPRLGPQQEG